jgi:hypothetical protein
MCKQSLRFICQVTGKPHPVWVYGDVNNVYNVNFVYIGTFRFLIEKNESGAEIFLIYYISLCS